MKKQPPALALCTGIGNELTDPRWGEDVFRYILGLPFIYFNRRHGTCLLGLMKFMRGEGCVSGMEKVISRLLWGVAVCLGGYLAARGFLALRENPPEVVKELLGQAYGTVEEEAVSWYLPVCFYEEGQQNSWLAKTWDGIWERFPLVTYLQHTEEDFVLVEDESTCHEIIEANGKTITDRLLAENQVQAVTDENQSAKSEEAAGNISGKEKGEAGGAGGQEQEKADVDTGVGEEDQKGGSDDGINGNGGTEDEGNTNERMEDGIGEKGGTDDSGGERGVNGTDDGRDENEGEQAVNGMDDGSVGDMGGKQLPAWTTAVETSPIKDLSMERLSDFNYLLNNFFVVDPNTTIDSSQMDAASLMGDDLKLTGDGSGPQILIYHTHSQEGYVDSIEGDENTSVIGVGNYLESLLTDVFGYQVIHMKDAFDLADGQLERSKAYNYALPAVQKVLDENPTIEVVIDLHRDGVPDDKHLVTEINGKPTAQIMYFNGLSRTVNNGNLDSLPNPYISDNLAFAFQLSYQAARYYPRLTRCIYLKGYRYNLHVRPRSILLEVGAQTNTVAEAMNAMEPFSVILNKVLKGE